MSHLKERTEKNCLNCNTTVIGRYCHVCGQENLVPKETVWHLVQHFFNDITHFDGKFFSTVKYLMRKPGFLSKEYMNGRRASYLNPIRMYVFTSAIFFLIVFSMKSPKEYINYKEDKKQQNGFHMKNDGNVVSITDNEADDQKLSLADLVKRKVKLQAEMAKADDDDKDDFQGSINKLNLEINGIIKTYGDTTTMRFDKAAENGLLAQAYLDSLKNTDLPASVRTSLSRTAKRLATTGHDNDGLEFLGIKAGDYADVESYDSTEKALPDSLKDNWITRNFTRKIIIANEEYHHDKKLYWEHFTENFLHSIPKILFFSLPFFALVLNIMYARRKKEYYYVSHGIFAIHVYCAIFILTMALVLLNKLGSTIEWRWVHTLFSIISFLIGFYMFIYLYKAMRGFYGQGRGKTFLKYFIACIAALIVNSIIMLIFVLISAVSV